MRAELRIVTGEKRDVHVCEVGNVDIGMRKAGMRFE